MGFTDAELWELARHAQADAFGILFDRHANAVYAYCLGRTANTAVAEDLTSITFLEAWRRRGEVRLSGDSARPWLLGVATNVLRNERRSLRRHRRALARLDLPTEPSFAEDAEARVDDEREMRLLRATLSELSEIDREILALYAWANLTYAELAVALDLPVGTVRSRLARARARVEERRREEQSGGASANRIPACEKGSQ